MSALNWIGDASTGWVVILLALAAGAAAIVFRKKQEPRDHGSRMLEDGEIVKLKVSARLVETGPGSRRYRPAKPDRS